MSGIVIRQTQTLAVGGAPWSWWFRPNLGLGEGLSHHRDRIAAFSERGDDAVVADQGFERRQDKGAGCRTFLSAASRGLPSRYLIASLFNICEGT